MLRVLLLIGPVLWVIGADIAPLLAMARISLLDVYPASPGHATAYSLANYAAFFNDRLYWGAFGRSVGFAAITTVLSLLISFPLAYHIALRVAPRRRLGHLLLLMAPFWTSEIVRGFAVIQLLANRGAVTLALQWSGLADHPPALLYGPFSLGLGMVYAVMLSMLLPLYVALERVPPDLLDAATDLGAGPWRRLWHVTVPLARDGIAAGCALVFLLGMGAFAVPTLLGGAGTTLFSMTIGGLFSSAAGRWPMGAAFSLIMLAAVPAVGVATFALAARARPIAIPAA